MATTATSTGVAPSFKYDRDAEDELFRLAGCDDQEAAEGAVKLDPNLLLETKVQVGGAVNDSVSITIISDPQYTCGVTSGNRLWNASHALASYLVDHFDCEQLRNGKVVELGAGLGMVGIVVGKLAPTSTVYLTDLPSQLPLLYHNAAANFEAENVSLIPTEKVQIDTSLVVTDLEFDDDDPLQPSAAVTADATKQDRGVKVKKQGDGESGRLFNGTAAVQVCSLVWGTDVKRDTSKRSHWRKASPVTMVVGTDVCYDMDEFHNLLRTLNSLCDETTVVLLAWPDREEAFQFLKCTQYSFEHKCVSKTDGGAEGVTVYVYQLTKRSDPKLHALLQDAFSHPGLVTINQEEDQEDDGFHSERGSLSDGDVEWGWGEI